MNEIYLASVTHDVKSNTLEALWLRQTESELEPVKRRNYSQEQKDEFLADTGADGQKYVVMAQW